MFDLVPQDVILNKAFQLACFIHGKKRTALKVLNSSLERLETAVAAQDKRLYYTPSGKQVPGRNRATGSRYKVSLSESQLLQRLIYLTSEPFEIQQELSHSPPFIGEQDMVIHFMKHLVHITMKRNSFYVALGMSRVLHDYTTGETIDIYNAVGQPDRMRDDDYYRSRKRRIMQEIKERFGSLIGVCQGQRAEERFIIEDCSGWKARLVERCLELFVPWDTLCLVPATPTIANISRFCSSHWDPDEEHSVEVDRYHALIHPNCYNRLTQSLGLDHPRSRLQVPSFFLSRNGHGPDDGPASMREHLPSLDDQDLNAIKHHIGERATRRRAASRGLLRIVADGNEIAQLDLRRSSTARIILREEADIIEVIADDAGGDLLLATHLLTHGESESDTQPSKQSIVLEGGQKLTFNIWRFANSAEDCSINIDITYQETNPVRAVLFFSAHRWRHLSDTLRQFREHPSLAFKPALLFALILSIVVGALVYMKWGKLSSSRPREAAGQSVPPPEPAVGRATPEEAPSNAQNEKHAGGLKTLPPPGITTGRGNSRSQSHRVAGNLLSKAPLESSATEDEATRDLQPQDPPLRVSLLEATKIYVQTSGDSVLDQHMQVLLTQRLLATGRFTVTDSKSANAALMISVRGTRTAGSEYRVNMRLQLLDPAGVVIWPVSGTARTYSGRAKSIATKAIGGLMDDIKQLENSHK